MRLTMLEFKFWKTIFHDINLSNRPYPTLLTQNTRLKANIKYLIQANAPLSPRPPPIFVQLLVSQSLDDDVTQQTCGGVVL